jgi:CubicO group peptidase (beta-lactamase class C family)
LKIFWRSNALIWFCNEAEWLGEPFESFFSEFAMLWKSRLALLALFTAFVFSDVRAGEIEEKLKAHMAGVAENGAFSGAVLVAKDGKPLLREAYGKANYELDVPNAADMKFRLGSITKQFTAMAVLILAEQGKLAVDDPISKHLENAPEAWEKITIRHLLTHTSGVPSYTGFPQMMMRTVRMPATLDEVIATFQDKPLEFEPGEKFTYSNSGYILLGKIIERASGHDYETFLKRNVFEPLEMNDTGYDHNGAILPRRAAGYTRTLVFLANSPYIDMSWPHAAGSLYSTVDDLAKWDQALAAGKLIGPDSYKAMFTPGKGTYGYGWMIRELNGHKVIGHGGGIHGFMTSILRYPDDKVLVVVLCNVVPTQVQKISQDLAKIALAGSDAKAE